MNTLWIVAGIVAAFAGLWMALPFLRKQQGQSDTGEASLSVYKDQLQEVDKDLASGLINEEEADAVRKEIEERANKVSNAADPPPAPSSRMPIVALIVVAVVAVGGLFSYQKLGAPSKPDMPLEERRMEKITKKAEAGDINSKIQLLIERTKDNPESFEDWWLLARSYASIGDNAQAVVAYGRASELSNNRPEVLSSYAESMTLANGNKVPQAARLIFEQVLNRVNDPRARYYIALANAQSQKFELALESWASLAKDSDPNAPWAALVRRDIVNMSRFTKSDVRKYLPDATADEIAAAGGVKEENSSSTDEDKLASRIAGLKVALQAEPKDYKSWIELIRLQAGRGDGKEALASLDAARAQFAAAPFLLSKIDEAARATGLTLMESRDKPKVAGPTTHDVAAAQDMSKQDQDDMIAGMVAGLAAKLEEQPNNPDGWVMLVRSYKVLGDKDKAEAALERAKSLFKDQPSILSQVIEQATQAN